MVIIYLKEETNDIVNALKENSLFADISKADLTNLVKLSDKIILDKNTEFIREGEATEYLYIIIEGEVAISKFDNKHGTDHIIAHLKRGDTIGEMSLLDQMPRSASAKTITQAQLLSISFDVIKDLASKKPAYNDVLLKIAGKISGKVRKTNNAVINALGKQLEDYKLRNSMGVYLINVVIGLCLFSFTLRWLATIHVASTTTTRITLPLTLCYLILGYIIIKYSHLPLTTFGLTTKNWRKSIFESIVFSIPFLILTLLIKVIMVHTETKLAGQPIFGLYHRIHVADGSLFSRETIWTLTLISYWLLVAPLQEFMARGGLQAPLQIFFTGKYMPLKAILVSNLIFATMHLFVSVKIALLVAIVGLYFGWLFYRHQNIIGPTIAHALIGTWAVFIVDIGFY